MLRDLDVRWSLRPVREIFTYRYGMGSTEYQKARFLFKSNVSGIWDVPVWSEATQKVSLISTDTVVPCDTNGDYRVGGRAIVWSSCDDWNIAEVASIQEGMSITLTEPVGDDHVSAFVMPLRSCICRNGINSVENTEKYTNIDVTMECVDDSGILLPREPVQIVLALCVADSMDDDANDDLTKLDMAKLNMKAIIGYLEESGQAHDVRLVGWADSQQALEISGASGSDWQDMRDFVDTIVTDGAADVEQAFLGADTFFSGTFRRLFFLVTDSVISSGVAAAQSIVSGISDLEIFGINLDLVSTSSTDQLDNQGGSNVVGAGTMLMHDSVLLTIMGIPNHDGCVLIECAKKSHKTVSGSITQYNVAIDSGMGPVQLEPVRNFVDETTEVDLVPQNIAERRFVKKILHFLCGQDKPFWIHDFRTPILVSTQTSAEVAQIRKDPSDWEGEVVLVGGKLRRVTSAITVSGRHRLVFQTLSPDPAPSGQMWRMRLLRQVSDDVSLNHTRGRHAYTTLLAGDA